LIVVWFFCLLQNLQTRCTHFAHISHTFRTHFAHISHTFRTHFAHASTGLVAVSVVRAGSLARWPQRQSRSRSAPRLAAGPAAGYRRCCRRRRCCCCCRCRRRRCRRCVNRHCRRLAAGLGGQVGLVVDQHRGIPCCRSSSSSSSSSLWWAGGCGAQRQEQDRAG
jgi:hypothetical protein